MAGQDGVGPPAPDEGGRRDSGVRAVLRFIVRSSRRIAVTVAGFVVVIVGIIMLPLPGPGWPIIFGGLAILSLEYAWARRLLERAKERARWAADRVRRRKRRSEGSG